MTNPNGTYHKTFLLIISVYKPLTKWFSACIKRQIFTKNAVLLLSQCFDWHDAAWFVSFAEEAMFCQNDRFSEAGVGSNICNAIFQFGASA